MKFSDPILQQLIKKYPEPNFQDRSEFLYEDLIESIVSQQLSIKAADTIFGRFKALFNPVMEQPVVISSKNEKSQSKKKKNSEKRDSSPLTQKNKSLTFPIPEQILEKSDEELRTAGLSFQKISYIKSVADAFLSDLIDKEKISHMSDEEVIATLTQIRGVGKWTAEMILIFTLKRPDIFSIGDLGLRNAIAKLYGITDPQAMLRLSESWKPHRSTASWYLWRSLENQ